VSDTVIPLLSRRFERALLLQKIPNLVGGVGVIADGVVRMQRGTQQYDLALGGAEVFVSLLALGLFANAVIAAVSPGAEPPREAPTGVDWIDVVLAATLAVGAVAHHEATRHWPGPTLLLSAVILVFGIFQGPIGARARRRRGLRLSNKGLSVGARLRRFAVEWADLKPIVVGDRWAVLESTGGAQHRIDLADLGNHQEVRDALREAEILRTAKRRFSEKAAPESNPDNTLYIRPVSRPIPIPASTPPSPAPIPAPVMAPIPPPPAPPGRRAPKPPTLIARPTIIQAAGNKPKTIEEYAGRVNSGHQAVSVARMISPEGWVEPGQQPEFEEITVVLRGLLRVEYRGGALEVRAGQAVVSHPGEWIRYSSPDPGGAEYVAICLPAFSPTTVHRDDG
jgi:mannose-6-phosphate isomerase-like protein (cupin superfamily)